MSDKEEGDQNFPLDRRKEQTQFTRKDGNDDGKNKVSNTDRRRQFEKILYKDDMKIDTYRVIIQKKRSSDQRPSISQLKVGDILYRRMKVGGEVTETKKIGRNRIIAICSNVQTANMLVENEELKKEHEVFIPFSFISRAVVIRNVDVEYNEEELKDEIDSGTYKILSMKRMKRRMFKDGNITFGDSESVKVFFEGSQVPAAVRLWGVRLACEPFMPPLIQCYRCLRYNHTTNQCKGKRVCKTCGSKDEPHECSLTESCINCKGAHKADSVECPEKKRQKTIKEMMAFQNLSFMEAMAMLPRYNERDNFSVVTSNRFQIFENMNENFPGLGQSRQTNQTERAFIFEPYRPTAQARRRVGLEPRFKSQRTPRTETTKRKKNTPNGSPREQEKKLCTEQAEKVSNLVGYEALRQDRNYSKYEESNQKYQKQKEQESYVKLNKNKKNESNETLIDLNSSKSSTTSDIDMGDSSASTNLASSVGT